MIGKEASVIIPAEFISPNTNSTGEYFFHIADELLRRGVGVSLVVPESEDNQNAFAQLQADWGTKVSADFVTSNSFTHGANFRKALSSLIITAKLWWVTRKKHTAETTVFFGTNPTFLVLFLAFFLPTKKFRKVLLCYDLFPENLIAVSNNIAYRCLGRLVKPLFELAYRRLSRVLVIGRCMNDKVLEWGVEAEKVGVVYNWADENEIFPLQPKPEPNEVTFQFFGNIGPLQGIDFILNSFQYVESTKATFTFFGRGAYVDKIKQFIDTNDSKVNVRFCGSVEKDKRNEVLNNCDVAIVSLDARLTGLGVPSKTYYSLAVGKPILVVADAESEPARLVIEESLGWWGCPKDPVALALTIDKICADWPTKPAPSVIRNTFMDRFSRAKGTAAICDEILNQDVL